MLTYYRRSRASITKRKARRAFWSSVIVVDFPFLPPFLFLFFPYSWCFAINEVGEEGGRKACRGDLWDCSASFHMGPEEIAQAGISIAADILVTDMALNGGFLGSEQSPYQLSARCLCLSGVGTYCYPLFPYARGDGLTVKQTPGITISRDGWQLIVYTR